MDKIFHVFVSSTFSDLKEERKKVSEALAKGGYVAEGMELFPASSQKQFDFIKRVIDRCDYYIVIIGGRYGSTADNNISYTEMEYHYAGELGIPRLAFLHRDPDKIELGKSEKGEENTARLRAFRERLLDSAMADFWGNPDELATKVIVALGQEATLNPGVGWVRGSQAADPEVYKELEESRRRIRELESSLRNYSSDIIVFPPDIEDIDAIVDFQFDYSLSTREGPNAPAKIITRDSLSISVSWHKLFILAGLSMYSSSDESNIIDSMCKHIFESERKKDKDHILKIKQNGNTMKLRFQFEALGVISARLDHREEKTSYMLNLYGGSGRGELVSIPFIKWELTEKGRHFLARSLAKKRVEDQAAT